MSLTLERGGKPLREQALRHRGRSWGTSRPHGLLMLTLQMHTLGRCSTDATPHAHAVAMTTHHQHRDVSPGAHARHHGAPRPSWHAQGCSEKIPFKI